MKYLTLAIYTFSALTFFSCQTDESSENEARQEMLDASGEPAIVVSLDNKELNPLPLAKDTREKYEQNLVKAMENYHDNPTDINNIIWYGRRKAYLGYYWEAIRIFTEGISMYPDSSQLYRHRGHRYITVRKFDEAIADLETAAQLAQEEENFVEPDGLPNKAGIPLSNNKFNIYYHLGLANYLKGDYYKALEAYRKCMQFSENPDLITATSDWLFMTYMRLGMEAEAQALLNDITADMEIIENDAYHKRLLMYKGEISPDSILDLEAVENNNQKLNVVTQGYGVGNWYLIQGDTAKAISIFKSLVDQNYWPAFGHIAAEADLLVLDSVAYNVN